MTWLTPFMTQHAETAVFLAIGLGCWIGLFKFKGVGFSPVTGSLIAGLVIGCFFNVPVSDTAKQLLFLLFMFGIGYSAGPGFIRGIQDGGWRWVAMGVLIPATGVLTAFTVAKLLNIEMGYAAGMMSGGLTESPVIGTASEAIRSLPISDKEKTRLIQQIPVADTLTHIFGTFGVIFFCSYIGPWIMRIDLKAEALKLEAEMGMERLAPGVSSAWHMFELRAYRLDAQEPMIGRTVAQAEAAVSPERLFIERVRRGDQIFAAQPDTVLQLGDVLAVIGLDEALLRVTQGHAVEVYDRELLDIPQATYDVEVTSRAVSGRTIADLRSETPVRGVFLKTIRRGSERLPVAPGTVVRRGDLLTLHALEPAVNRVAALVGNVSRPTLNTDFVALGLAIFAGALAGMALTFPVGGLHIALGSSVAVLLVGLGMGWRNSTRPLFAHIPPGAVEFMKSIGLAAVQERSESPVAVIGYSSTVAFGHILISIGGTALIWMLH